MKNRYVKTFEGFTHPDDQEIKDDYYEIASIIIEGLKKDFKEKFKEKILYDDKSNLIMELRFNNSINEEKGKDILTRARISMAAMGYDNEYKCKSEIEGDTFKLIVQTK